jgi:hypothetical protein
MIRKVVFAFGTVLCLSANNVALTAESLQAGKVSRVAVLLNIPPTTPDTIAAWNAFQQTLEERGYIEGKNIEFDRRFAEGRTENFPLLAANLMRLWGANSQCDAIRLRRAVLHVPVVMVPFAPCANFSSSPSIC